MKEVSNDKYNQIVELQKTNGINYSEHYKGSKKVLMVDNRIVCATYFGSMLDLGNLQKSQFISFIASFKRGLYKQFDNNRENQQFYDDLAWEGLHEFLPQEDINRIIETINEARDRGLDCN